MPASCPEKNAIEEANRAGLEGEIRRLRAANAAVAESLRNLEAMAWLEIQPTSDPREVCKALAAKVRDTADVRIVGVYLTQPETLMLEQALCVPDFAAQCVSAEFEAQLNAHMVGWSMRERRLVVTQALARADEGSGECVILLPIATQRQVWGLALCFSACHHEQVSQNTLRLLNIVANHFGMALENASLMRALAEHNRDLEKTVTRRTAELLASKKRLEEAYAELQRLDAAKDDFLSLVAHELRTPLTSILSFSEFLGEDGLAPEEVKEFASSIHREATRLHRLVNDVLDMAKMEAGKLTYRYTEGDLNEMVVLCLTTMAPNAAKRRIKLRFDRAPNLPRIRFDRDRIQQVILNMLSNAIKFSNDGSEIAVATQDRDDSIALSVTDFGVGIAARDIPKVFNKFEQIQDVKRHAGGTGFGMPIAKQIIEAGHGGKMWVESEGRGKGSTFYFTLPKKRLQSSATSSAGNDWRQPCATTQRASNA